ncbi:MAG: hypothetical protein J6P49_01865 [Paludibacteraceae bacterium]|nr:hypothetical protein [Paludibacteraceae bacterium]
MQFLDEFNKNTGQHLTADEYREQLRQYCPTLKRWQKKYPLDNSAARRHANAPLQNPAERLMHNNITLKVYEKSIFSPRGAVHRGDDGRMQGRHGKQE